MKTVIADKIASVAQHAGLRRELRVSADIPCEEGVLVAVEILNNKATYNLRKVSAGPKQNATLKPADTIIVRQRKLFGN